MKKIICKILEVMFPTATNRIKAERAETNRAKRAAIQALLDATNELRRKGVDVNRINDRMDGALDAYLSGDFSRAVSWAEMEARKPSWAATC